MYRIAFNPKLGVWQIQLLVWGFRWATVKTADSGKPKTLDFHDYDSAAHYVEKVGLARVYRSYRDSAVGHIMNDGVSGYQPQRRPAPPPQYPDVLMREGAVGYAQ